MFASVFFVYLIMDVLFASNSAHLEALISWLGSPLLAELVRGLAQQLCRGLAAWALTGHALEQFLAKELRKI